MHKLLISVFLFSSHLLFAQKFAIKLDHYAPVSSTEDLKQLDRYFNGKCLIGLGESTHGTHEFFVMRHRLIKYLVENHSFNTIFMEADFANSLMINDYISGEGGTAHAAVDNLNLWPWETEEMVALVEWMKAYNLTNADKSIQFIGVDVQKVDETIRRLEQLLARYNLPLRDEEIISASEFYKLGKKEVLKLRDDEISRYEKVVIKDFDEEDQHEYKWLFRHLTQILSEKLDKKSLRNIYRDNMMGQNILKHLDDNPEMKGIFWAHNGHVASFYFPKKERGVAGGVVKKSLGEKYFILAQDFDFGRFNARTKPRDYNRRYANWEMTKVEVAQSPAGSLAANYRSIDHPIIFIPFDQLPDEEEVNINSIGAIYYETKKGDESVYLRRNHYGRKAFDALILIKESTPTNLLNSE